MRWDYRAEAAPTKRVPSRCTGQVPETGEHPHFGPEAEPHPHRAALPSQRGAPTGVRTRREPPLPPERTEARHAEARRGPDGLEAIASARRVRHFRAGVVLPGRRCLETAVLGGSAPVRRRGWARGGGVGPAEGCEVLLGLRGGLGGG